MNLISVAEARERILSRLKAVARETIPLAESVDRVLGQDIIATTDLPLFNNSSMDGFAIRSVDLATENGAPPVLRVVTDIPAGAQPAVSLGPGEAARIMTGAPLPPGADAVIPIEDTDLRNLRAGATPPHSVRAMRQVKGGENVRTRGMDIKAGEIVLHVGHVLRPQDLGLLASLGQALIPVYRKPRVALLSSGDELLPVEAPLQPGKIYDSNSYVLSALVEKAGALLIRLGVAPDRRDAVEGLLEQAAHAQADLIISSAGVSVGAFDFVKEVVDSKGRLDFWRVNMRPGKPLAFGEYRGTPFIGLPGNPVSAFVGFQVFVCPALERLNGRQTTSRRVIRVILGEEVHSDGRESYLRGEIREESGALVAYLSGHQGSANSVALVRANALLIIPAGVKSAPAGREVDAWML